MSSDNKLLYGDPYVTLTVSASTGLYRFTRSPLPYPSIAEMQHGFMQLLERLHSLKPQRAALLVDMRLAPARNDPAFEEAQAQLRQRMLSHFDRLATLVASTTGLLHVQRFSRQDRIPVVGFVSEPAAVDYLLTGVLPASRS